MRRVAFIAADSLKQMDGVGEALLFPAALMADEASFGIPLGAGAEGKDQFGGSGSFGVVAAGRFFAVGVSFARPVAHLAARNGFPAFRHKARVRVFAYSRDSARWHEVQRSAPT
jgi:hypothetical protein